MIEARNSEMAAITFSTCPAIELTVGLLHVKEFASGQFGMRFDECDSNEGASAS
jgi:hypothetical protein